MLRVFFLACASISEWRQLHRGNIAAKSKPSSTAKIAKTGSFYRRKKSSVKNLSVTNTSGQDIAPSMTLPTSMPPPSGISTTSTAVTSTDCTMQGQEKSKKFAKSDTAKTKNKSKSRQKTVVQDISAILPTTSSQEILAPSTTSGQEVSMTPPTSSRQEISTSMVQPTSAPLLLDDNMPTNSAAVTSEYCTTMQIQKKKVKKFC